MGLFSRHKSEKSSSPRDTNGNSRNHYEHSNGAPPFGMKRMNSNPAQNAVMPDIPLPKAPDPHIDPAGYLRSIYAVRERSRLVLEKATRNQLRHFHVDMSKFNDTANFVVSIIKVYNKATTTMPIYTDV
jgi:hypothetical protein